MPFILTSPSAANITIAAVTNLYQEPWIGKLEPEDAGGWIDELLLLVTLTRLHLKRSVLNQFDFGNLRPTSVSAEHRRDVLPGVLPESPLLSQRCPG